MLLSENALLGHVHMSPVTCHLPCLSYFLSYLGKTVFMLKPLEARRKKTLCDAAVGGLVIYRLTKNICGRQKHKQISVFLSN